MIYPSSQHVLRCASKALDDAVKSEATGRKGALSVIGTGAHLMRYVSLRLEIEPTILAEDIVALRGLLPELIAYLESLDSNEPGSADAVRQMVSGLSADDGGGLGHLDLPSLSAQAARLRECLYQTQKLLQGEMRGRRKAEAGYLRARQAIRDYIALQLMREADLIVPAFGGKGPRR